MTNLQEEIEARKFENKFTAALGRLHEYFSMGREALRRCGTTKRRYGDQVTQQLAAEYGVSNSVIEQARSAARNYDEDQLRDMIERCREAGYVPSREMFAILGSIPVSKRTDWEERVLDGGWSIRELKLQKRLVFGKRSGGGRYHANPASLAHVEDKLGQVRRQLEILEWSLTHSFRRSRSKPDLTDVIAALDEQLERLDRSKD